MSVMLPGYVCLPILCIQIAIWIRHSPHLESTGIVHTEGIDCARDHRTYYHLWKLGVIPQFLDDGAGKPYEGTAIVHSRIIMSPSSHFLSV